MKFRRLITMLFLATLLMLLCTVTLICTILFYPEIVFVRHAFIRKYQSCYISFKCIIRIYFLWINSNMCITFWPVDKNYAPKWGDI